MTVDTITQDFPNDVEAERHVLGAALISNGRSLDDVGLDPERFYRPAHALIAEAMLAMRRDGQPIDPVTVIDHLVRRGTIKQAGDAVYVHQLFADTVTAANVRHYWEQVTDAWARRVVVQEGMALADRARDYELPREQTVERARSSLDRLAESIHGATDAPSIGDIVPRVIDNLTAKRSFTPTGWTDLDAVIGGWRPGAVYVVAARPGNGKSIFALNAAMHVAQTQRALFHSLEMTEDEVTTRAVAAMSRVPMQKFGTGEDLPDGDWDKVSRAVGKLDGLQLTIDERTSVDVAAIHSRARSEQRRHGSLGLVVVDYLQLVTARRERRDENREQQVAGISRALKLLAMDLRVPVLLCAQLNRQSEHRADGRPRLSDLRESGAVEQDSDVVMLLHRDPDEEKRAGEVDVIVDKNRHGPRSCVTLAWQAHVSRLDNLSWSPTGSLR